MTHVNKPYAGACDRNRDPILQAIRPLLSGHHTVLEIGSGTGQHAVYFAGKMPHLTWITSDLEAAHDGIRMWLEEAGLPNVSGPLLLDLEDETWPAVDADVVFTANTIHIISWELAKTMFTGVAMSLPGGGLFMAYGPFNYGGGYTSESNAGFDQWLRDRDSRSGIRNFEDVDTLARDAGLDFLEDLEMPANNRLLVWQKAGSAVID